MLDWQTEFRHRLRRFGDVHRSAAGETVVSIKVRVQSGCFHREHSPHAYALIDRYLHSLASDDADISFEEHESGPEILVWIAATTAGLTLAKSVVDLVTTIIKARSESVKKGDCPSEPVELIVRRVSKEDEFQDEKILRVGHDDQIDPEEIEAALRRALEKLLKKGEARGG